MTRSSFYGDTPNYATSFPTQNDSNTQPVNGNTKAPSSFYPNGTTYATLANSDTLTATFNADIATANAAANTATTQASNASSSASAAATSAANAANAVQNAAGTATPLVDGTAAVGTSTKWAHEDHVHPTDTSRAPVASPSFTGTVTQTNVGAQLNVYDTTAITVGVGGEVNLQAVNNAVAPVTYAAIKGYGTNGNTGSESGDLQILVRTSGTLGQWGRFVSNGRLLFNSGQQLIPGASGTLTLPAITDTLAGLTSPAFSGTPTAPTPTAGDNSTKIATTAFVATSFAPLASPALTGNPTAPTPTVGDSSTKIATTAFVQAAVPPLIRSYLAGLTLSTAGSSTTFSVAAGDAVDSTNADFMKLTSSLNKTTSAWAVGTGNGSLDTGSIAASTWYHVHLIKRTDTGVVDVLVSLSASAPTMPASYTLFRRIGSLLTNGSSQWTAFTQLGDEFLWKTPVQNLNSSATSATAASVTVTTPLNVQTTAKLTMEIVFNTAAAATSLYALDMGTQVNGTPAGYLSQFSASTSATGPGGHFDIRTNTSSQIGVVSNQAGGLLYLVTYGWIDRRGRDN